MKHNTIIYIGGFQLPDKNAAAHRVISNGKIFRDLDYQVVFIDTNDDANKEICNTKTSYYNFETFSMQDSYRKIISISDFLKVYKRYENSVFAVIAYNYPAIPLYKLKSFCKRKHIYLFADCTEWYGFIGDNFLHKLIKGIDSFLRMNILQPRIDGIIVISKYLENYYKPKLPCICIPPLTDTKEEKWNYQNKKRTDTIKILYAGSPGKHKDKINVIIEAIAKANCRNIHFLIVGICEKQFLEYYPEDKVMLEEIKGYVSFKGRVPHNQVLQLLKESDYSLFFREINRVTMAGFPTKFSESITCGVPVITNETSDLSEYLKDGKNGFILSTKDFSNDLSRLLFDISKNRVEIPKVDNQAFDFTQYINLMKKWFSQFYLL